MSFSGDDFEFDIDFEFDAPRFYDFSRPELYSETEEIEIWFQSSGNYPPSRKNTHSSSTILFTIHIIYVFVWFISAFSPKFNWKFEPFKQITNTISESKPVEIIESSEAETGLNCKDKFNGNDSEIFVYA